MPAATERPAHLLGFVFGLSTDYGVFLLGRIKEARDRGLPAREAVAVGLSQTGAVAIGAFTTSSVLFIKRIGLGAALGVLIDALVVRGLLVLIGVGRRSLAAVGPTWHPARMPGPSSALEGARLGKAVRSSDVVALATHSAAPVIHPDWVRPGTHVTSVGYKPPRGELPPRTLGAELARAAEQGVGRTVEV